MVLERNNIAEERVNIRPTRFTKLIKFFKSVFNSVSLPYIILLLLTCNITVFYDKPFAYVMLAVASLFNIPLSIPLIATMVGFVMFRGQPVMYTGYLITYFIYLVSTVLINIDGLPKKYSTLIRLVSSYVISVICIGIFKGFNIIYVLHSFITLFTITAMYPIFINGNSMLFNIRKTIIFSKEEIICFGVVIATVLTVFSSVSILNFSVSNVLLMVLIIVIAWKNDWVVGTSAGVVIGLVYSIITGQSTLVITACGFSGLVAGSLSKYGKIPVVIAFAVGNMALSYLYTKDIMLWTKLAEILVASGVIISLPKKVIVKFESIFNVGNALPVGYENQLGPASELKSKVGAIGEVFDNLAHITTPVSEETMEETANVIEKYLRDYKKNECLSCKNRFECLNDEEIKVASIHIARRLEENKCITREMLPLDCNMVDDIINDIIEIYNNMKLMRIIRLKENEMNYKLAEEYSVVSKLLKKVAGQKQPKLSDTTNQRQRRIREELRFLGYVVYEDSFYEDERDMSYEFITDILVDIEKAKTEIQRAVSSVVGIKMSIKLILNSSKTEKSRIKLVPSSKYILNAVVKQIKKIDSNVNGDSYIVTELKDNNKIIAISDGMGSGEKSKEASLAVINMLESLVKTGINQPDILNITNRVLRTREGGTMLATLDMCLLNEKKNAMEFVKLGAAPSFVISDGITKKIEASGDSIGTTKDAVYSEYSSEIKRNTYVVMMSDGAVSDINEKKLQNIVNNLGDNLNETKLMEELMNSIMNNQSKLVLDDITIITAKIS